MLQLQVVVSGNVQGVGYRYFAQRKAIQFGITGWARNRSDGAVEMVITGTKENLDLFIEEIRRGNPFSTVDQIEIHEVQTIEKYSSFTIKY